MSTIRKAFRRTKANNEQKDLGKRGRSVGAITEGVDTYAALIVSIIFLKDCVRLEARELIVLLDKQDKELTFHRALYSTITSDLHC
eukprot:2383404-Amphidinium_carterae.1